MPTASIPQLLIDQHVLVVEDDPVMAEVVAATLRRAGASTSVSATAMGALDAIAAHSPTVVLLDLNLPDASGLDLLESFRRHSDVPVLVLTGTADPSFRDSAIKAGASEFLLKPVSSRLLVEKLRFVIDTPHSEILAAVTRSGAPQRPSDPTSEDDALSKELAETNGTKDGKSEPMSYGKFIEGLDDVLSDADAFVRQFIQRGGQ